VGTAVVAPDAEVNARMPTRALQLLRISLSNRVRQWQRKSRRSV
jgi:hypothetical protein